MTLSASTVKVKVTGLLNFRKLHFSRSIWCAILQWSSKLMIDYDSIGPSLQHVRAQFLNFLLRKLSRDLRICRMSILHEIQRAILPYLLDATCMWSGVLVVPYVLCTLIWPSPNPSSKSTSGWWPQPCSAAFYFHTLHVCQDFWHKTIIWNHNTDKCRTLVPLAP